MDATSLGQDPNQHAEHAVHSVADPAHGTILATVLIRSTIDHVFAALTGADEIVRWWGSEDTYRTTAWEAHVRPGGSWRASGVNHENKPFLVQGEFLEVSPPLKLVQSWRPDWDQGHTTIVTYRLETIDSTTRVTIRHEGFAGRPQACEAHRLGWQHVLQWLDQYCAGNAPAAAVPKRFFLLRLVPSRPTFAQDLSDEERAAMTAHVGYWQQLLRIGTVIAFGPVADPAGTWGVGLVEVADESQVALLEQNDPAIKAGIGLYYEVLPMPRLLVRGRPEPRGGS